MGTDLPLGTDRPLDAIETGSPQGTTRRAFFADVGKRAAYVTPVLLTLSAGQALASGHAVSCKPAGTSCTTNEDCCSNVCNPANLCTG